MDCGLLSATCSSSRWQSPRKSRSVKKQWSIKRHSDEYLHEPSREWPVDSALYEILDLAGKGAHAAVYRGRCTVYDEIVAIKRLDLDCNWDLTALIREATLMKKFNHPAVLPLYAAFVAGNELWFVTPYMGLGSARSIMKRHFPMGLDEVVIATIMQPVLLALEYVHRNNGIHRDVKADNILVSEEGDVVLADFGVAAARMRPVSMVNLDMQTVMATTFVGTPCWMAPEVMQQTEEGYHTSADIWSFGITLIELAHGRPPLARMNPLRVLMDTMSKPPPQLGEHQSGTTFSKAFKELVEDCLQKDPDKRPTAAALLTHRFFRMARDPAFLKQHFLAGLVQQQPQEAMPTPFSPRGLKKDLQPLSTAGAGPLQHSPSAGFRAKQQLAQQQGWPGAAAARLGSGLLSGPSSFGPSRLISGWFFPSAAAGLRMSSHCEAGIGGPGHASAAARAAPGTGPGTPARSTASAMSGSLGSPAVANSISSGGTSSVGSLEQQLQPFMVQQAMLRAGSGGCASCSSGPSGFLGGPRSAESMRLGSTHQFTASMHPGQLEPYLEVEGAEEEAAAAAAAAGTGPGDTAGTTTVRTGTGVSHASSSVTYNDESKPLAGGANLQTCPISSSTSRGGSGTAESAGVLSVGLAGPSFVLQDGHWAAAGTGAAETSLPAAARPSYTSNSSFGGRSSTVGGDSARSSVAGTSHSSSSSLAGLTQALVEAMLAPTIPPANISVHEQSGVAAGQKGATCAREDGAQPAADGVSCISNNQQLPSLALQLMQEPCTKLGGVHGTLPAAAVAAPTADSDAYNIQEHAVGQPAGVAGGTSVAGVDAVAMVVTTAARELQAAPEGEQSKCSRLQHPMGQQQIGLQQQGSTKSPAQSPAKSPSLKDKLGLVLHLKECV